MKYLKIILPLLFFLAFFFRIWHVTSVPPSLYWDEVSQGYNAYSILKTGKDEHQESFPLARFQAFGDYKAPIYIYLDVPFIALLGKTELAVRFPSILLGSLSVIVVYFLVQKMLYLFAKKEEIGLWAAFFLAISPWHIQLSRAAFEGNIATFFTLLGITLFFWAIREKPWMLILSALSVVVAIYSFNAHRVFLPLLLLACTGIEWKILVKLKKQVLVAGIIGSILLIPFIGFIRTPESKLRFQEVNIFSNVEIIEKSNKLISQDGNNFLAKIIHNRRVLYSQEYLKHYFDFFSPTYLFFSGDVNPRFSDQENGELYLWMLPLLLVGAYLLLSRINKNSLVLLGWFLLAPVAAATARETPHALRSETFIPTYEILAAMGIVTLLMLSRKYLKQFHVVSLSLVGIIILFSLVQFWHNYLLHNPVSYSSAWQYGYKQTIQKVKTIEQNYDHIYMTDVYGRAYIYVAWYADFSPEQVWGQITSNKDAYGLYTVSRLGKYYFTENYTQVKDGKNLFVTTPDHIPSGTHVIDTISFLNGKPAFVISEPL